MAKFKRILLIVFLLAAIISPNSVIANEGMMLKKFQVDIWPEYDDPKVLVIYQGTFVNKGNTDFLGYVKFNIPKFEIPEEGKINMACEIVNGGNHSCQPYTLEDKGEFIELSWKTTKAIKPAQEYPVFLEFYYNPLEDSPQKSFTYEFISNYDSQALDVNIKQPLRTENFQISPEPLVTNEDSKGFSNHKYSYQDLTTREQLKFEIKYVKNDKESSILKETQQQSSVGKVETQPLPKTEAWKNPVIYITMAVFVLILVVLLIFALLKNKSEKEVKLKDTNPRLKDEKKKLRQLLVDGQITEQTYQELIKDLEEEYQ